MPQVKAVFFVPLWDNNGRELSGEIADLETDLYRTFVGWTMMGTVNGMYQMADLRPAFDECNSYMLLTEESRIGELEQILLDFKAKTTQEAIYLEVQRDVDVRFL